MQAATREYRPRKPSRSRAGGSGLLLGLFLGFLLGLGVSAAIAVYLFNTPVPFINRTRPPEKPVPPNQNLSETAKPPTPEQGKPRFDFYRILPGQEEPVTGEQLKAAAAREKSGKAQETAKDTYFLQAGAFQNPADADNLKARLALLGLEASVEPTSLAEKGVWYRVRLGPYIRIDDINRARSQLAQNGIDVSLVKIKDDASKNQEVPQ